MADWEEVKRLAADFQRAQLSSTKQRLSERNVVEIVSKLVDLKLIEVIYTVDGKEYLTLQELAKEIKDELFVHGGRINIVELQQILNVDFSHVESKVNEIVKHDKNLTLVLGQLVDRSYLDRLAEEVNDKLQEQGHVTIGELTKFYDLPADFLSENIHQRVGSIIKGHVDSFDKNVIFTDAFLTRMRARIRGAFSAITRPTTLLTILQQYDFQERIFFTILEDLVQSSRLAGTISGGRQNNATYVPDIYTKSQNEWVDSFYKQNGYLEYDSLSRLGISDPKGFIKKRYKSEPLVYLSTCCAGRALQEQVEASVEEALSQDSWVDVMPLLPSIFSPSDASQVVSNILHKHQGALLCCDTIVVSESFVSNSAKPFDRLMHSKAQKDTQSHPIFIHSEGDKKGTAKLAGSEDGKEDKKEQRRKKALGGSGTTKGGAGSQGRETKTKSTKKKYKPGRDHEDSDEENVNPTAKGKQQTELTFMSIEEIETVLKKGPEFEECPDDLVTEIAQKLFRPLTKQYQELAKSIFLQSTGAATGSARKKTHGELQERLTGLWTNAKLFEKGLKLFQDETQANLSRHLLRTVCTDIANMVVNAIATDHMMSVTDESHLTAESRARLITKLQETDGSLEALTKLHTSLNGKSLDEFFTHLDSICDPAHLGIMLKKPDKRKERQLIFNHRQALLDQLSGETDAAMSLHLASVILFQTYTQTIVHAPGKCVPHIVQFLKTHMEEEKYNSLSLLQELIVKQMKQQEGDPGSEADVLIAELVPKVKEIAITTKKNAQNSEDQT